MIHFTLFGIPCYIRPSFWVVMAIFGGALNISGASDIMFTALFVIAGLMAILGHELGHALVGKKMGGGEQTVILEMFGGVTLSQGMRLDKLGRVCMISAGPLMTLVLGLIALAVIWNPVAPLFESNEINPLWLLVAPQVFVEATAPNLLIFAHLVFIGTWWTILNLLPIVPLDGGHLMAEFIKSPKKVFLIGIITSVIVAILSYHYLNSFFLAALMGLFAYQNFKAFKDAPF